MKVFSPVKHHMQRVPAVVHPDMEVCEAVSLLLRHHTSAIPVTSACGKLVGILTEQDCLDAFLNDEYYDSPTALVRDLMTTDVVTVESDASILQASELFSRHRFHLLPVLSGQRLVGQISRRDVIAAILKAHRSMEAEYIRERAFPTPIRMPKHATDHPSGRATHPSGSPASAQEEIP